MQFFLVPLHRWLAIDTAHLQRRYFKMQRLHVRGIQRNLTLQQLNFEEHNTRFCGSNERLLVENKTIIKWQKQSKDGLLTGYSA